VFNEHYYQIVKLSTYWESAKKIKSKLWSFIEKKTLHIFDPKPLNAASQNNTYTEKEGLK
jgi:hypothetical protein